ncbi:MAG: hypothetical protein ACI4F7_07475 [Acutalibacteraceae bacterium]
MRIQVVKTVDKMPEGDYIGKIVYQSVSKDYKYLWLNIEVDGFSSQLNISISLSSNLLNNFAMNFADKYGELDTEDFINARISFSLIDKEINEHIYSKFSRLELISDEEENDFE